MGRTRTPGTTGSVCSFGGMPQRFRLNLRSFYRMPQFACALLDERHLLVLSFWVEPSTFRQSSRQASSGQGVEGDTVKSAAVNSPPLIPPRQMGGRRKKKRAPVSRKLSAKQAFARLRSHAALVLTSGTKKPITSAIVRWGRWSRRNEWWGCLPLAALSAAGWAWDSKLGPFTDA